MHPLAGLQKFPLIPGTNLEGFVPGVGPTYEDVVAGRDLVRYDRVPVRIAEFRAEVFDMMSGADRKRYEDRMIELVRGIQTAECVIWKNELQVMSSEGGQKWMRYLEWARYELNDPLLQRGSGDAGKGGGDAVETPKGVISEVGE